MSFKKSPQAMSLSEVEEGRGLQAPAPGVVANSPVSLSSSLPFIPISLTFRVNANCCACMLGSHPACQRMACTHIPSAPLIVLLAVISPDHIVD